MCLVFEGKISALWLTTTFMRSVDFPCTHERNKKLKRLEEKNDGQYTQDKSSMLNELASCINVVVYIFFIYPLIGKPLRHSNIVINCIIRGKGKILLKNYFH
jgi:hypothetical protein